MYYILLTIFVGMIPEVLYFTKFMEYSKDLKEHRIKFFILETLVYTLCVLISQYKILYYLIFIFLFCVIMKLLYKEKVQIIDIFVFSLAFSYLTLTSLLCFLFVKEDMSNYYFIAIIHRIILFIPFIFKNKFNVFYKKYKSLWNRNDNEKRVIKSITLRNISLICLNIFIFISNLILIYITNIK